MRILVKANWDSWLPLFSMQIFRTGTWLVPLSSLWLQRHCSLGWIRVVAVLILLPSLPLLLGQAEDDFLLFCWKNMIWNQETWLLALNLPLVALRLRASHFFKPEFSLLQSEGIRFSSIQKFCDSFQHSLDNLHLFEIVIKSFLSFVISGWYSPKFFYVFFFSHRS